MSGVPVRQISRLTGVTIIFLRGQEGLCRRDAFRVYRGHKGAGDARFHDMRHSFAVASLLAGDDVKTVQENLSHATAAFTLDVLDVYNP